MVQTRPPNKFEIASDWSGGFAASLLPAERRPSESDHWLAGYDAGYGFRSQKNEKMNEYLVSIGMQPMGVVRIC